MIRRTFLALTTILLLVSAAIAQESAETVAKVDGEAISEQDLREASGASLARLEEQAYRLKEQKLDWMIEERLLAHEARRRNISVESLIDKEITSKTPEVTPQEIQSAYDLYKNQVRKPESEVDGQLRTLLHDRKVAARRQEFVKSLRATADVSVHMSPPPTFRANVGMEGPSRGAVDAPITIVEFEDFQCPFCKRAQDTLEPVLARYKERVRMVHRDLPLRTLHPASWKAHEAGRCAEEQGKFWEYRALLYKNAPAASPQELSNYASQAGLNVSDFTKCLDSGKFNAVVQKDEDEANRLGIQGTPVFFINGRLLSGAQPESEFVRIIEDELNKPRSDRDSKTTEVDKTLRKTASSR
jgi:protein-disulfide isomerase